MAANRNGKCGVGAAYGAKVGGEKVQTDLLYCVTQAVGAYPAPCCCYLPLLTGTMWIMYVVIRQRVVRNLSQQLT